MGLVPACACTHVLRRSQGMQRNPNRPLACRGLCASFFSKTTLVMAVRRWGGKRKMWEMGVGDSAITRL